MMLSSDFDFLSDNQSTDLTEEEWVMLTDTSYVNTNSDVSINSGKKRKKQSNNVGSSGGKKKKP